MQIAEHVNPPKQARSRKTLERIAKASLAILDEEGPEALTVQAIVDRAGSSVGSFYARFQGKDDLLDYLGSRAWSEAAERWDQVLASRDWSDLALAQLIDGSVALLADAARSRGAYLKGLNHAGATDDPFARFQNHVLAGLADVLLGRRDEIEHGNPQLAVRLGLTAVVGLLDAAGTSRLEAVSALELRTEAGRLLRAYLQPGQTSDSAPGSVDFFDIWG